MKLQKSNLTGNQSDKPNDNRRRHYNRPRPQSVNQPKKTLPENPTQPQQKKESNQERRPANNYPLVSVIVPLLNEEDSLQELAQKIENVFSTINYNFEVVFVDDGSTDKSFDVIRNLHRKNPRFHCIKFRRNYGKSAALAKGFRAAKGSIVITMDADLQDDPNEIPELINMINSGYDLVSGWKKVRYDPFIKKYTSRFFNYVTSKLSGIRLHDFNCGLKAYRKEVVKTVRVYGEMHRYIPAIAHLSGFKVTEKVVKHHARKHGKTKFGPGRFLSGFFDVLTLTFTHRFMKKPLHFFGALGMMSSGLGTLISLYLIALKYFEGQSLSDRPLFLGAIFLIIIGVQLFSIGLLAEMMTKYNEKDDDVQIEKLF